MSKTFAVACALVATFIATTAVHAQGWPVKPIRLIVGYPPGGPVDLLARAIAPALGNKLGQPIVIENKAGASGTIGMDATIKAAPDGYTFGMGTPGGITSLPHVMKLPYDPQKIAYVSLVARVPQIIVVNSELKETTLPDLIKAAKAAPKKFNFGSAGNATTPHLGGELLRQEAGIEIVHVPYKGAAPAIAGLMGNEIQIFAGDLSGVLPLIQSGRLRALAIETAQRVDFLPQVPTAVELGYPKILVESNYGIIMPAGIPATIVTKFHQAMVETLGQPEVRGQIVKQGAIPASSTPEEYRQIMQAESAKWAAVIKAGNIRLE
jgi:tripartite-type tricarboxylate transporter receptor subunit TctC